LNPELYTLNPERWTLEGDRLGSPRRCRPTRRCRPGKTL